VPAASSIAYRETEPNPAGIDLGQHRARMRHAAGQRVQFGQQARLAGGEVVVEVGDSRVGQLTLSIVPSSSMRNSIGALPLPT
jgi:hypothetical protein